MNGINNTHTVKSIMGHRLKKARTDAKMTRQVLADKLSQNPLAPSSGVTMERLKQWEYGNNAIAIEWIPAICNELSFDVGFLFGEYEERNRISSDIVKETGLSESAISSLKYIRSLNPEYINVLSVLLQDGNLEYLLYLISKRFMQALNSGSVKPDVELQNGKYHLKNTPEYQRYIESREIKIQFDGAVLHAQKSNLLDSLITSTIINRLDSMSLEYQNTDGGSNK